MDTLKKSLATILTRMNSVSALSGVEVTTKAVNFIVSNNNSTFSKSKALHFDTVDLDPTATNSGVTFDASNEVDGFSIKYPNDDSFVASNIHFSADLVVDHGAKIYLYVDNALKATATMEAIGSANFVT